jgi:hypothetical protein
MCLSETYSKAQTGIKVVQYISHTEWSETKRCFIAIALQLLQYAIRKVQDNQVGLELQETHRLTICPLVNWNRENIDTINHNTEDLSNAKKDVGQLV